MSDQNDKPTESDDKNPEEQSLADAPCSLSQQILRRDEMKNMANEMKASAIKMQQDSINVTGHRDSYARVTMRRIKILEKVFGFEVDEMMNDHFLPTADELKRVPDMRDDGSDNWQPPENS